MERWIRLDLAWEDSPWLDSLDGAAAGCWPRLLVWVKRDGARGRCKQVAHNVLARRWRLPEKTISIFLAAAVKHGAVEIDGSDWVVTGWEKYQKPDPTVKERVSRWRERQVTSVTVGNGVTDSYPSRDGDGDGDGDVVRSAVPSPSEEFEVAQQPAPSNPPAASKQPQRRKREQPPLPPECQQILDAQWLAHAPLPPSSQTPTGTRKCLEVIRQLHETDALPWPEVARVVEHGAKVWQPEGWMLSPAKLRKPTKSGECRVWEAIRAQLDQPSGSNGRPAKSAADFTPHYHRPYVPDPPSTELLAAIERRKAAEAGQ